MGTGSIMPPHWSEDGEVIKPAAYVSGKKMRIIGSINHDCPDPFWIRAKVSTTTTKLFTTFLPTGIIQIPVSIPVEIKFPAMSFNTSDDNTGSPATYSGISDVGFEALLTDYYDKSLPIEWEVAKDENGPYTNFKTSMHTLYVTHKEPLKLKDVFETTIHIGCAEAKGKCAPNEIVDWAWIPFGNLNVARVGDGAIFSYWKDCGSGRCGSLKAFLELETPDARCQEFVDLFKAIIENQGIQGFKEIKFKPPEPQNDLPADILKEFGTEDFRAKIWGEGFGRFAVKDWSSYIEPNNISNNFFKLDNIPAGCGPNWAAGDTGIKGQGQVIDPLSLHANHIALTYKSLIYDPSYGTRKVSDRATFEDDNLDTVSGLIIECEINGVTEYYYWIGGLNTLNTEETIN